MDYLVFDALALALPAALLLRGVRRPQVVLVPGAVLALAALMWTAPWDEHLVRTGVWTYAPDQVLGRVGAVPVEEYAFVVLQVLLVGAWALRVGALPTGAGTAPAGSFGGRPPRQAPPRRAGGVPPTRRRGALGWGAVAAAGLLLVLAGGQLRYLGLLLLWAAPPLALQRAVAGDVLADRRAARLRTAVPVFLWLCTADRLALARGIWAIAPGSSTGSSVLGLPVEEALFFALTCLLVTDGLLLAADPVVLRRVRATLAGVLGSPGPLPSRAGAHCPRGPHARSWAASPRGPEATMHATVGDHILTPGRHVGDAVRAGEVTEVRGSGDTLLYVVRWDDGHEGVCSPGPETKVAPRP